MPFDISWKVAGFNRVRLDFALKLAYASKAAPTKVVLERALNSILLPNTLKKNSKQALSTSEIFKQLQALVPGVTQVEGTIFNSSTGEYVDVLSRAAGTIFETNLDLVVTKIV